MSEVYIDIDKYISKEEDMALDKYKEEEEITIGLVPYKEISYKYDSGYGAYCCEQIMDTDEMPETFKISGNFVTQLIIGQTYEAKGKVQIYNKKKQLKVSEIKKIIPKTIRTIKLFLKSLDGMGPFSDLIYEEYGEKAIDIIKNTPLELKKLCPAIYDEQALGWQKQLLEMSDYQEYLTDLINFGMKPIQAKQFFDIYKELSIEKIKENPYRLIKEIKGFGFLKCDTIAKNMGYPLDSDSRIYYSILYILNTAQYDGNTYMNENELLTKVSDLLDVKLPVREMKAFYKQNEHSKKALYKIGNISFNIDMNDIKKAVFEYEKAKYQKDKDDAKLVIFSIPKDKIEHQIKMLQISGNIIIDEKHGSKKIYDKYLYLCEDFIAKKLYDIESNSIEIDDDIDVVNLLNRYLDKKNIKLEEMQYQAVINSASTFGGFSVINGSAGCGKTFTLNIALKLIETIYTYKYGYFEPIILAPTGRAAKVASNSTNRFASTIHKALRPQSDGLFFFNALNNLPYNCVIVDETSMLDVEMAKYLFEAISRKTKVIFIGDTKQLASVGPGNVLRDIITSNKFKITTLNVAKRQGKDSGIYKNATRIIMGEMIKSEIETKDAYVFNSKENSIIITKVLSLYESLYKQLKLEEIQLLVPQKGGILGTNYLNFILQDKFNHENNDVRILNKQISVILEKGNSAKYELYFKKGDKVINTKNNYDLPWYILKDGKLVLEDHNLAGVSNGETGKIVKIIQSKDENKNIVNRIVVKFDEKYIIYVNDFENLDHAYAMTIHKSQGSEWPAVIMPITFASYRMLERNLIYTGYTRAKKWISVIGDINAIKYGIETEKSIERQTGLYDRILEIFD